jgi:protein-S-isoprenylcysteine O-methyltransferase Ste14
MSGNIGSGRKGLGAEHPLNDKVQAVFLVAYLVVWGLDSFVFRFSTVLAGLVPVLIRVILVVISLAVAIYLAAKSTGVIFRKADDKPKFITTGVYAWVRHPMYLAALLVLLPFFFMTLSLLSILVWVGLFVFLDRMATYEERDLIRILGEQYLNYQRQVPKWFPHIRRKTALTD